MKKVFLVIGTRPEAIKMAPVYQALKRRPEIHTTLISTGQHRELIDQALGAFGMVPDLDLRVMRPGQSLSGLTCAILSGLEKAFARATPDLVLAHGDTTTCFSTALACFYRQIPVAHVEAGLRTYRLDSPFPEEFNRQSVAKLADIHFAPDDLARKNLLQEGVDDSRISVTGTTTLDAIRAIQGRNSRPVSNTPIAVVTLHRREQGPESLREMLNGLKTAAGLSPETTFICPIHPNPSVQHAAHEILGDVRNIRLIPPVEYRDFVGLLSQAKVVITDSGGIQEEAAYLGKRVLLLRDQTERVDGLKTGQVSVVGTQRVAITEAIVRALRSPSDTFTKQIDDGSPSDRIACEVERRLALKSARRLA